MTKTRCISFLTLVILTAFLSPSDAEGDPPGELCEDFKRTKCCLSFLSNLPEKGMVAEIGVFKGSLSGQILRISKPQELYLIDPWKHFEDGESPFSKAGCNVNQQAQDERYKTVTSVFGKREGVHILRNTSTAALEYIADNSLDWVYIDACHWYQCVIQDLKAYIGKVRVNGYICGHDYGTPGSPWEDGVTKAVTEFVAEQNFSSSGKVCWYSLDDDESAILKHPKWPSKSFCLRRLV